MHRLAYHRNSGRLSQMAKCMSERMYTAMRNSAVRLWEKGHRTVHSARQGWQRVRERSEGRAAVDVDLVGFHLQPLQPMVMRRATELGRLEVQRQHCEPCWVASGAVPLPQAAVGVGRLAACLAVAYRDSTLAVRTESIPLVADSTLASVR